MLNKKYITASCTITRGTVFKSGQKLFADEELAPPGFLVAVYRYFTLSYPKFYKMDSLSKLGWLASEVLLGDQNLKERYQPGKVGLVIANKNASLDNDIKYHHTISDGPSPSVFVYTLPNIVIGEICIRNNFKGEHAFFVQEKFNAGFIHSQVTYLLDKGILDACICGWIDLLGGDYKACLFLIERKSVEEGTPFSPADMDGVFEKS